MLRVYCKRYFQYLILILIAMAKNLDGALSDIIKDGEFTGGELKRISGIFSKHIDNHRKELLSPVTGKDDRCGEAQ